MSWMSEQADVVQRTVVGREWEGQPARVVVLSRTYPTDIDDLWNALTTPERMERWFMPVAGDLREGGHYQLTGNAGGTIRSCQPPRALAVTWEFNGGMSWVNVTLAEESNDITLLTLEHIAADTPESRAFWEQYGPGAVGVGWDLGLLGLAYHVTDPAWRRPADETAFMASAEGLAFTVQSSDAWGEASRAYGTDGAAAQAAAERTTHFFTGGAAGKAS